MGRANGSIIGPVNAPTSSTAKGVWSLDEQYEAQRAGTWPPTTNQYQISRSLRFNSADSAFLSRSFGSVGNRKTWTISFWFKKTQLSGAYWDWLLSASGNNGFVINYDGAFFSQFVFYDDTGTVVVFNGSFRDPSAWYHVVLAFDSTQATDSNRVRVYVNGVELTKASATYPALNSDGIFNNNIQHVFGRWNFSSGSRYMNGYMTEVNFVGGQALTPSSFGQTNSTTGVWEPIQYAGSYGTNGFYLNFSDNSGTTATTLGKDYSGNGNNWTPNNFSVTAGAGNDSLVDVPTSWGIDNGAGGEVRGNYATLNPLNAKLGAGSLTNGNLTFTGPSGTSAYNFVGGTFPIDTSTTIGWYFEITQTTYGLYGCVSLLDTGFYTSALNTLETIGSPESSGVNATAGISYRNDGKLYNYGAAVVSGLTTWASNGDVIGIAIKDNKIWFAKNGSWISGNPSSGTSPSVTLASTKFVSPAGTGISSCVFDYNFGQRPFAYTAPSGFKALCTQNLPTPGVVQGDDYFNTVLYTGNGGTQTVSSVGFQPDFVWYKSRVSNVYNHGLFDAVRGVSKFLASNSTAAEVTVSGVSSFNAGGFTLGSDAGGNENNASMVAWNWNAGGSTVTNTAGTISAQVRANQTAGFSVVTFTAASGTSNFTVGHGLGATPSMVIVKSRSNGTAPWYVYHASLATNNYLRLNTTNAVTSDTDQWGAGMTSTVIGLRAGYSTVASTDTVAYCFAAIPGYSAFGSYTGNGSTDGPFVHLGFRPRYILVKNATTGSTQWVIQDTARMPYNAGNNANLLAANSTVAENDPSTLAGGTQCYADWLSSGFKIRANNGNWNTANDTYIFMAFAENPFKYSLAR